MKAGDHQYVKRTALAKNIGSFSIKKILITEH